MRDNGNNRAPPPPRGRENAGLTCTDAGDDLNNGKVVDGRKVSVAAVMPRDALSKRQTIKRKCELHVHERSCALPAWSSQRRPQQQ